MSETDPKSVGILAALRRVGDSVLGLVQSRLQLFALELQGEKLRLVDTLFWFGIGLGVGGLGLVVGTLTVALYLWEVAHYAGLLVLTVALVGAAGMVLRCLRERLRKEPLPFADTLAELKKDRACLRKQD